VPYLYEIVLRPLAPEDGGGWFAEVPALPGCASDGETGQEAIQNAHEAIEAWIDTAKAMWRKIPEPTSTETFSGRWLQRVPRSLHQRLAYTAKREGVSLNTLVSTLIAEGLGKKHDEAA